MSKLGQTTEEAELARAYQNSRDLSAFETDAEPVEVRRNVTISVRFSDDEIARLRAMAEQTGMKVTAYIRTAALEHVFKSTNQPFLLSSVRLPTMLLRQSACWARSPFRSQFR
jgi:predicted DNA-binding protein